MARRKIAPQQQTATQPRFPRPVHGQLITTGEELYNALMGSGMAGWMADPKMRQVGKFMNPLRVVIDKTNPLWQHELHFEEVLPEFCGDYI
jgi:hypothetical protein